MLRNRKKIARRKFFERGVRGFPFLFTFGSAFFGFSSMVFAVQGERVAAIYCIFVSALLDALDGRVARLMKVESELGVQLDSLCDAISFCLAPAFLAYMYPLRSLGFFGIVICSLFLIAGLFRLARFNILQDQQKVFFTGLPTTIAGCFLAIVLLNSSGVMYNMTFVFFLSTLLLVLSWLMVSRIKFPAFKQPGIRIKKNYYVVAIVILFAVLAVMRLEVSLLVFFSFYFLLAFGYNIYSFFKGKLNESI